MMERITLFILLTTLSVLTLGHGGSSTHYANYEKDIEAFDDFVKGKLQAMSLEEKVGQMTQLDISFFLKPNTAELDEDLLRTVVRKYYIGSILNNPFSQGKIGDKATFNSIEWRALISQIQKVFLTEGSKIPMIYGLDSVHGANYIRGATIFPQQINTAASFSPELAREMGRVTSKYNYHLINELTVRDTREVGIPWIFAPILDPAVEPRWARVYETFGEDPHVGSVLGVALIEGAQGGVPPNLNTDVTTAACIKHFVGYPIPRTGHDRAPSWIPDRILYQYFLPAFRAAIQKATTMESYNEVSGVPVASSHQYLVKILREELGFKGMLVTDYNEIKNLHSWHRIVPSIFEATHVSINRTSIDMSMVPTDLSFPEHLVQLVKEGKIPQSRIDVSAGRVLQLKKDLGLFERPLPPTTPITAGDPKDRKLALEMARESIVLLKNRNNLLPFKEKTFPTHKKVLLTGPSSNSLKYQSGGWTVHWQGALDDSSFDFGSTVLGSLREALKDSVEVVHSQGCPIEGPCDPSELNATLALAKQADVVVVCVGEKAYAEKPGDINDLSMEQGQLELVKALTGVGVPTVMVLLEGRPRVIGSDIVDRVDAILMAFLPGPEGGQAISEILLGTVNPSGRMPITYPRHTGDLPVQYYHKWSSADTYHPQFAFGDGLSYTSFTYSNLVINKHSILSNETIQVKVDVRNSGSVKGKEVVMMYISDLYRIVTPEVKMLKGFQKISLEPNESKTVSFLVTPDDLSFYGIDKKNQLEAGDFQLSIGNLRETFRLNLVKEEKEEEEEEMLVISTRDVAKYLSITFVVGMTVGLLIVFAGCQISNRKNPRHYSYLGENLTQ